MKVISIAAGERPPHERSSPDVELDSEFVDGPSEESLSSGSSDSSQQLALPSEAQLLRAAVSDSIQSLFKLSMAIRRPAPKDRYAKAASLPAFDPSYDTTHLWQKFPKARDTPWLFERLAKANVRRRQYLQYRERHHEKLAGTYASLSRTTENLSRAKERTNMRMDSATAPIDETRTAIDSNRPSDLDRTLATIFVPPSKDTPEFGNGENQASEADISVTSFATSVDGQSPDIITLPPPPTDSANMNPFECPICFTIQINTSEAAWKRHVLRDLQPWVCTAKDCSSRTYDTSHEWFDHEILVHRRQLSCEVCQQQVLSERQLLEHLRSVHTTNYGEMQIPAVMEKSFRQVLSINPKDCPLCDEWAEVVRERTLMSSPNIDPDLIVVTPKQFRKHLGSHLEQISLFALPRGLYVEDDQDVDSNAAAGTTKEDTVSVMVSELESSAFSKCHRKPAITDSDVGSHHVSLDGFDVYEVYEAGIQKSMNESKPRKITGPWRSGRTPQVDLQRLQRSYYQR